MPANLRFIAIRIASMLGLLWVLTIVVFALQELSDTDPVAATIGNSASPEAIAAARERLGLDRPVLVRYFSYLAGLLRGDFGTSFRTHNPVTQDLASAFPATMELVGGDIETQADRVFRNLRAVCKAAGSDLGGIVKLNLYLTDMGNFAAVNEVMKRYFSEPFPARAAIGVAALPLGAEVEAEAVLGL